MWDFTCSIRDVGCRMLVVSYVGYGMQDAGCELQAAGYGMQDAG